MTTHAHESLTEHDPVLVTEEDLDDLSTFTGLPRAACLERLQRYSTRELAEAWRKSNPQTREEILSFYRSTDLYVWALMQWHASSTRSAYREALQHLVEHFPAASGWSRVCDFGSGIGTDALFLATHGYEVTLVDVDSPTFRFARHRFARRQLGSRFLESTSELPELEGSFDVVICFDVFEHLPDPLGAAKRLVDGLRPGGLFVQHGSFMDEGDHPCHLANGVRRFGGLKWHVHLEGAGLRSVTGMIYRRASPAERVIQVMRHAFWRATGFWVIRV